MKNICSFCDVGELETVAYTHIVKAGRSSVSVAGCSKMVCSHCGEESIPLEMYGENAKLVEAALAATPAAISRALLKSLRERFSLSQRDASKLFGAGDASFAKWESGQSEMSGPAALLAQCALNVSGVIEYLAHLSDVEVAQPVSARSDRGRAEYSQALKSADIVLAQSQPIRGHMYLVKTSGTRSRSWDGEYKSAGDLRLAA